MNELTNEFAQYNKALKEAIRVAKIYVKLGIYSDKTMRNMTDEELVEWNSWNLD